VVAHEPYPEDFHYLPIAYYGGADDVLRSYIKRRRSELESRLPAGVEVYGEVNSLLRYFTPQLQEEYGDPFMAFLVRNGRDFVRSAYIRNVYTKNATHTHIVPKDGDPWVDYWFEFSRFKKLCWYWNHTNSHLAECLSRSIRFEDLLGSYATLKEAILKPLDLSLSEEVYRRELVNPRNTSAEYERKRLRSRFSWFRRKSSSSPSPRLGDWTEEMEQSFSTLCGETMARLGYA
jgi:hypothetical protein